MNDEKMRAECDRILTEMIKAAERHIIDESLGMLKISGQLFLAKKAITDVDAATFRKIHLIGELSSVLIAFGYNINAEDWYDYVPYSRDTELAFEGVN